MRRRLTDGNMCMGAVVGPSDKKRVKMEAGMDNARERTHVLLMPRDLIHRQIIDPKDEVIGYIRDLLIDEVDWKVRFLHAT